MKINGYCFFIFRITRTSGPGAFRDLMSDNEYYVNFYFLHNGSSAQNTPAPRITNPTNRPPNRNIARRQKRRRNLPTTGVNDFPREIPSLRSEFPRLGNSNGKVRQRPSFGADELEMLQINTKLKKPRGSLLGILRKNRGRV